MANTKKLIQAAAGAAGGEEQQIGVNFPGYGAETYLSGSGFSNSTTATVSFWYFVGKRTGSQYVVAQANNRGLQVRVLGSYLRIDLSDSSNNTIMFSNGKVPAGEYGWNHFLMSVNTGSASTSEIAVNDVVYDPQWSTYSTNSINFNQTVYVGNTYDSGNWENEGFGGSLAYFYIDTTFRNLNTTSNRRLFIDGDLNPVTDFSSLSPVIYLPLTDEDTAGTNEGSGTDFTVNGAVNTTKFGVNNFPFAPKATKFDGSNDALSSTDDIPNTTQFTLSFSLRKVDTDGGGLFNTYTTNFGTNVSYDSSKITVNLKNSSNSTLTEFTFPNYTKGDISHIALCVDMSSQSLCRAFVNGEEVSLTFNSFTSGTIANASKSVYIGRRGNATNSASYLKADIGELYYDNAYIDLSSNNIFWDADNNKAKSVRKVLDETGNTPLIALPIDSIKPQINLGTNSDFTANSFPVYGGKPNFANVKRGYYAGNSPYGSVQTTDLGFTADSKELTVIFSCRNRSATTSTRGYFKFINTSNSGQFIRLEQNQANGYPYFRSENSGNVLNSVTTGEVVFVNNEWNTFMMSVDMTSTARRWIYKNHRSVSTTWSDYVNKNFAFNSFNSFVLFHQGTTSSISGPCTSDLSNIYITDDYIDLSSTQNRNYFIDGAGFPNDLTTYIEDSLIPTPKLYLKFDDPDNIGKNSGTGGDLTVSGNVETGFDVNAIS